MLKKLIAIAAAAGVNALPLLVVSPAAAATIPEGDSLFAISCDSEGEADIAYFYDVDPDTADLTFVDDTGVVNDCAGPAAYNPLTGVSYYLAWNEGALAVVNTETGQATTTPITGDSTADPDGLAIGADGRGWIIWDDDLYSVDLGTGATALVVGLAESCLYSFALDPTDGQFYVLQCNTGEAFRLSVTDGVLTPIGTVQLEAQSYTMQIDTAGRWWVQMETGEFTDTSLWSMPRPSGSTEPEYEGDLYNSVDDFEPHIDSLLLTYPVRPVLAATGMDMTPVIGGALGLLAFGAGFALLARGRRAAQVV